MDRTARTMSSSVTLPIRKRRARKTVTRTVPLTAVREIPRSLTSLCFCHACKYEVLCEPWDLPEDKYGPIIFVAESDGDGAPQQCYCHECKYEVLCAPCDLPDGRDGPIPFVPLTDEDE